MIRILFLAANPLDQAHLRIRQEFDELRRTLDSAEYGKRFALIPEFAVAAGQLQAVLFRHQPQIIHFSGHGQENGALLFEGADGVSHPVSAQALHDLFAHFSQTVHCVVLNACYSQTQASAIAAVIDSVVGMNDAVTDEATLNFAPAFFRALANGKSLTAAVELGCNQLDLQNLNEAHKPHLWAERIDADKISALAWDDAAPTAASPAPQINTGGGAAVGHDVLTNGGDFVGRDKTVIQQQTNIYNLAAPTTPPQATTTPRGIFGLYPFNEHFFGRDVALATLHTLLQTQTNVSICPVITGMGGLGKTQLAAHYTRAHIEDYPDGIFWITAADLNAIRPQLADFCVALGLPVADPQRSGDLTEQKISAIKHYLDQHPHALLIFDNVEEPDHLRTRQIGAQITPLTLGGRVIITTRRRKLAGDRFAELPLERLLPAPAHQILTTARAELDADPDSERLCAQFGYLPLMLNLAAAALKKRGGAIAGYLQRLHTLGAEKLHSEVAKVSLDDYHHSLSAVLHEQCAMLHDANAHLLLRVAGQLPEAAALPKARLGLLAGLVDLDEWERPLGDALDELEAASLIERVDATTVRLHPLVRDFAEALVTIEERADFRITCAIHMSNTFNDLARLGSEYQQRGITALIADLVTALEFTQSPVATHNFKLADSIRTMLQLLRREAFKLAGNKTSWQPERLWQQLLYQARAMNLQSIEAASKKLLQQTIYWYPHWLARRESSNLEQTFIEHRAPVNALTKLDDNHIASASSDHTIKIWNLYTGEIEQILLGHKNGVNDVVKFDNYRVVSASSDHTIKLWNIYTGEVEQTLLGHNASVKAIAKINDMKIVSASYDRTIKIWNLYTGKVERTFLAHKRSINAIVKFDDTHIISASSDRTLKLWNLDTGQVEQTFLGHQDKVGAVAQLDDTFIISASHDRTIKIWNIYTGKVKKTLTGHINFVHAVVKLDNTYIASASYDRTIKIWNLHTGEIEKTFTGHEREVNDIIKFDKTRIISAATDRTVKIWNLHLNQVDKPCLGHDDSVQAIAAFDDTRIISASYDRSIKVWNLQNGQVEHTILGHTDSVHDIAKLDETRIISASSDRTIKLWNINTGQNEQSLSGHQSYVRAVIRFSENNIISGADDGSIKIWNLLTGMDEQTLVGHVRSVTTIVKLNETNIISSSFDRKIIIWDLHRGEAKYILSSHKRPVNDIVKLDDKYIASASSDCTLKIWNLNNLEVEQILTGHKDWVLAVAKFDDTRIVSTSFDHTLKVWNWLTGKEIASIELDGAPQCIVVTQYDNHNLVLVGDKAGSLYCLELVEPVRTERQTDESATTN